MTTILAMQRPRSMPCAWFLAIALALVAATHECPVLGDEFFEKDIRPILVQRCEECHGATKQEGGLRLDSRKGWQTGGDRGPAVKPGDPELSLLISAVKYTDKDLQMPPEAPLSVGEVALLTKWVKSGAPDPRATELPSTVASDDWTKAFQERSKWWSLQPLRPAKVPEVRDRTWARVPIDRFVQARREAERLPPAGVAEGEVLLRRLSFVLTGLPPTPQQREDFLEHWSRDPESAYEQLVDQLLASPHFGERLARHWMDVVRFSDTYGYESDNRANGSWEYRDYLIRAFNQDVGFDQMVTEHLAGDLLPLPRIDEVSQINESMIGPMFFHLGEHREGGSLMFNGAHQQMVDNKIDAFSKAFLALTVACARCHDHKLEAVSQRDYYALAAVFMMPRWTSRVIDAADKHNAAIVRLKDLRTEIRRELARQWLSKVQEKNAWTLSKLKNAISDAEAAGAKSEDPVHPILQLAGVEEPNKVWEGLVGRWRATREQRLAENSRFTVLTDFRDKQLPRGWVTEGDGIKHGYVEEATPLIAIDGDAVVSRLLARGYHTAALSTKLPGALRTPPQHLVPGQFMSVELAGDEFAGYLVVQQNGFKSEEIGFLKSHQPAWKSFADAALKNGVQRVTVEFATTDLNPNFPPRPGLSAGLPPNDAGYGKRSWLSITGIVGHDQPGAPQDTLDHFASLYQQEAPRSSEEAEQRIQHWLTGVVQRWCDKTSAAGDLRILNWLLAAKLLPNKPEPETTLADLVTQYRDVQRAIEQPRTVTGMDERESPKSGYPLNVRGNVDVVGAEVPPDFLQIFAGRNAVASSIGSGRLELAACLVDLGNPLTARVYVNRVWHWVFGTGLVATPNDFGHLGDGPSHPELLDYLAREFMREGWSTKTLVRRLVLSETFRQSSGTTPLALKQDPDNRLLHHFATRRLEAEAIRDSLLAVSGRLDASLYGQPIDPPRLLEDSVNKRLFSGPLDGRGRRSIYLTLSVMDPPKFLIGFNLPDLKLPSGRRDVTNVPAQALILMNDPFVTHLSKYWSAELIKEAHASPHERINAMFVKAFGRTPSTEEQSRWEAALGSFASSQDANLMIDQVAWQRLAHAMFNAAELIYIR